MSKTIIWSSKSIPERILDVMRKSRRARPWTLAELSAKAEASTGSTATALRRLFRARRVNRVVVQTTRGPYLYGYTVPRP